MSDTEIEQEKVDQCGGACFGRQRIRRSRRGKTTWSFQGDCKEGCRLQNECFTKSVQDYEEKHIAEKEIAAVAPSGIRTKENFHYPEDHSSGEAVITETLGGFEITPESRAVLFEFARRIWELYRTRPALFEVMLRRLFANEDVADIAREQNISRQTISARLAREVAGMKPEKQQFRESLRGFERSVYELCFEDGCTIRSAAIQLGVSKDKIYRVRQVLSRKLNQNATNTTMKN